MDQNAVYESDNIFAKILRGEMPCHRVFEDDVALAFLDIMPRTKGHTLVIPKAPARNLLDMPPALIGPFMERVQTVARAVVKGMEAEGLTVHQYNETAGGQVIFHLHFHILPRWEGVRLQPHTGELAQEDVLHTHKKKIRAAF